MSLRPTRPPRHAALAIGADREKTYIRAELAETSSSASGYSQTSEFLADVPPPAFSALARNVWSLGDQIGSSLGGTPWLGSPRRPQLGEQVAGGAGPAGRNVRIALFDLRANRGIARFEIVLHLVGVHNTRDRDAVLFEDEVLLVQVYALHDLAEVYARSGYGETVQHSCVSFDHD